MLGNFSLDGMLPVCGADHVDIFFPADQRTGAPLPGKFPVLS
eukprot:SAG22_NODE_8276_length_668_cov_0.906854_1_plen_41_part_10